MTATPLVPQPETEAGVASAEDGLVILDGPSGLALTLTAQAANDTGESLIAAAEAAGKQLEQKGGGSDV